MAFSFSVTVYIEETTMPMMIASRASKGNLLLIILYVRFDYSKY
jgi:hypothetical protein